MIDKTTPEDLSAADVKTTLSSLFNALDSGEVTLAQVAKALDTNTHGLRIRMSKWGHRLPLMLSILDKLEQRKISRDEAAEILEINVRNVNKLEQSWGVKKPITENIVRLTAIKIKWQLQYKYAIDFISGSLTLEDAAEASKLSTRSVRRKVEALLDKHKQMTYKDLVELTPSKRSRIADEIEFAEHLDFTTQASLRAIAEGDKPIQVEAIERIVTKRARRVAPRRPVRPTKESKDVV